MANEATITSGLRIVKQDSTTGRTTLGFSGPIQGHQADVTGNFGPTPGSVAVTTGGVDIDLSALATPGLCVLHNQDDTYAVEVGIYEPDTEAFYPFVELLAGEQYVLRLSRNLLEQYAGTGTGTTAPTNFVRARAIGGAMNLFFGAFER